MSKLALYYPLADLYQNATWLAIIRSDNVLLECMFFVLLNNFVVNKLANGWHLMKMQKHVWHALQWCLARGEGCCNLPHLKNNVHVQKQQTFFYLRLFLQCLSATLSLVCFQLVKEKSSYSSQPSQDLHQVPSIRDGQLHRLCLHSYEPFLYSWEKTLTLDSKFLCDHYYIDRSLSKIVPKRLQ